MTILTWCVPYCSTVLHSAKFISGIIYSTCPAYTLKCARRSSSCERAQTASHHVLLAMAIVDPCQFCPAFHQKRQLIDSFSNLKSSQITVDSVDNTCTFGIYWNLANAPVQLAFVDCLQFGLALVRSGIANKPEKLSESGSERTDCSV